MKKSAVVFACSLLFFPLTRTDVLFSQPSVRCIALLTDLRGEVFVRAGREIDFKKAQWGTQLAIGDVVKTSVDGSASILLSDNNLISLGPGSSITISENPGVAQGKSKAIRGVNTKDAVDLSGLTLRSTSEGEVVALAGLRGWKPEISLVQVSPRNSGIRSTTPTFRWRGNVPADRFKVTVYDRQGRVWTADTKQTNLEYPKTEKPLTEGEKYFWQVEGIGRVESYKSPSMGFNVLSKNDLALVEDRERRLQRSFSDDSSATSYQLLIGTLYQRVGLLEEAVAQFEAIAERYPEAPAAHEVLGKLYSDLGFNDKSIAALQKALKLSQGK